MPWFIGTFTVDVIVPPVSDDERRRITATTTDGTWRMLSLNNRTTAGAAGHTGGRREGIVTVQREPAVIHLDGSGKWWSSIFMG